MIQPNFDLRIRKVENLLPPVALFEYCIPSKVAIENVQRTRNAISNIINQKDQRLLVVIGPCSIHDPVAALEYAKKIKAMRELPEINQNLEIVMRAYFEKPRTTVGWKGLINDPFLNSTYAINEGLKIGRKMLCDINNLEVPTAIEFLDIITPQYMADLISWGAIGARTTESQVHREMCSGLSCPVGFKNATNGSVKIALDAVCCAKSEHSFMSVNKYGYLSIISTSGNPDCHIILRGGDDCTNYDEKSVADACKKLAELGHQPNLMIDFSHANSQKQFKKQLEVATDVCKQITNGSFAISGVMVESNLKEGSQQLKENQDPNELIYGQSITDSCIGWEDTEKLLFDLAQAVKQRNSK